jgi:peroxin-19
LLLNEGVKKADDVVAATLEMFSKAQQGMEGFDTTKMEEVGEDMMEDMMAQFEALGEKEDYNDVIDGVMKQLLSRNLMYEPTKQICEKFPEWLAIHKSKLSEADYTNYGLQYQAFQKLLAVYDTEPDNFPRFSTMHILIKSAYLFTVMKVNGINVRFTKIWAASS